MCYLELEKEIGYNNARWKKEMESQSMCRELGGGGEVQNEEYVCVEGDQTLDALHVHTETTSMQQIKSQNIVSPFRMQSSSTNMSTS